MPVLTSPQTSACYRGRSYTKLSVKLVSELSEAEVAECSQLTLPRGIMRYSLQRTREAMNPCVRDRQRLRALKTAHALLLRNPKGKLIAWALVKYGNSNLTKEMTAYLFVGLRSRRRGHGSRLVVEIRRRWPKAEFCPWNEESAAFFHTHESLPYEPGFAARAIKFHSHNHTRAPTPAPQPQFGDHVLHPRVCELAPPNQNQLHLFADLS